MICGLTDVLDSFSVSMQPFPAKLTTFSTSFARNFNPLEEQTSCSVQLIEVLALKKD